MKKEPYKRNKKDVLENANALYDGVKIIIDGFERGVFEYGGRPGIDVDYDFETYGLTKKELQMFKFFFNYTNLNGLWNELMYTDWEKYVELLNDLKIKQRVLNKEIDTKTGIERERLVNVVNTIKYILDNVGGKRDMHDSEILDLESEESAAQKNNQQGRGLKILTPNQILSRLPISLAQLKAGNNSEKLKNEIRQLLYSLYRSKKLTKQLYKSLVDII